MRPSPHSRRLELLNARLATLPSFGEFWPSSTPDVQHLLRQHGFEEWVNVQTHILVAFSDQTRRAEDIERDLFGPILAPSQRAIISSRPATPKLRLFQPFYGMLAIESAAVVCNRAAHDAISPTLLRDALRLNHAFSATTGNPPEDVARGNMAGTAAAISERSDLGDLLGFIDLAFAMWVWDHALLDTRATMARQYFDSHLNSKIGIGLVDWVTGVAIPAFHAPMQAAGLSAEPTHTFHFPQHSLSTRGNDVLPRVLNRCAATIDQFIATCREHNARAPLWISASLEPLRRFPVLQSDDRSRFWMLSPLHFAEAAVLRPLAELEETNNKQEVRGYFGDVVEGCCHGLLFEAFGGHYNRIDGKGLADGLICGSNIALVVEIKSALKSERARYAFRDDQAFEDELRRRQYVSKALGQIAATIHGIDSGQLQLRAESRPTTVGSLIVQFEDMPLHVIAEDVLTKVLPACTPRGRGFVLRPQLISIYELMELQRFSHLPLLDVLRIKQRTGNDSLESLPNYLRITNRNVGKQQRLLRMDDEFWKSIRGCFARNGTAG